MVKGQPLTTTYSKLFFLAQNLISWCSTHEPLPKSIPKKKHYPKDAHISPMILRITKSTHIISPKYRRVNHAIA